MTRAMLVTPLVVWLGVALLLNSDRFEERCADAFRRLAEYTRPA